ncbi:MAG: tRNA dihydrouridine synthase DusB [Verrucomicrobiae bacterium]|nr:tRNA dihydrouridine synthase DusB [Verrucomicrobiae bacterium]
MPVRIGEIAISSNLFLAPLAGYTNLPFRLAIRPLGGLGLATTDLVNARSLLERHAKSFKLIETAPGDEPLAVQLFGAVPEEMRDAALLLQERGVRMVDVNMGCPVRKVVRAGSGAALLADTARVARLVRTMTAALRIPLTCKMRLGWDSENLTAPDVARAAEDAGAAAITIHGRTRAQGFSGRVNLDGIAAVVRAVRRIPVVGNGDVTTPRAAKEMFERTGCAAVSIGRGAFSNPWIFAQTRALLDGATPPAEPGFDARIAFMSAHLDRMADVFGEETGCRMFRKVAAWSVRRLGPAAEFKRRLAGLRTRADFDAIVAHWRAWRQPFLGPDGELLPQYRPQDVLHADSLSKDGLPIPRGPSEWW